MHEAERERKGSGSVESEGHSGHCESKLRIDDVNTEIALEVPRNSLLMSLCVFYFIDPYFTNFFDLFMS